MKPRDLINDKYHFFIWCLIDDNDKSHFLVLSVNNFKKTMGTSLKGISFFKDQDRQELHDNDFPMPKRSPIKRMDDEDLKFAIDNNEPDE